MSPLISVTDVAVLTGLSAYTIRQAVREGDLPGVKIRGRVRIYPDDLTAWVERNRIEPATPGGARGAAPAPAPRRRPPEGGYRAAAKQRRAA